MNTGLNYRHLYYFWVVAKAGGMTRGAERLGMAVQSVSQQVRDLERDLGHALLKPAGRGLQLTEAGHAALAQAEQIFALGEQLPQLVKEAATTPQMRLNVGISGGVPKLVTRHLLAPILATPHLHLHCHEDDIDDLLGALALHRLDLVLADRPAPPNPNLRLYTHTLERSHLAWFVHPDLLPQPATPLLDALRSLPVLLPSAHNAVRQRLNHWLEQQAIHPHIAGEFEDSAMLVTFGASGMGVFPAQMAIHDQLTSRYGVTCLGPCDGVEESVYAITAERRIQHALLRQLLEQRPKT